jgi:hypothetical protein
MAHSFGGGWPDERALRAVPFHGGNTGSNPVGGTGVRGVCARWEYDLIINTAPGDASSSRFVGA